MPLDPQAAAFLQEAAEAGAEPFQDLTPAEARVAVRAFRDFGGDPEPVAHIQYDFIPGPTADLPARIYRPHGTSEGQTLPGLIFFHGSGWVVHNIALFDSVNRSLSNCTGCVLVAVNYQKAPEHKFPIPFDDCYSATEWVFENATELGIDSERIGVIGDSAGGNLAAAVTLKARDAAGPKIAYQVLIYPAVQYGWDTPSSLENAEGYLLERAAMEYFWNHYVRDPSDGENPYCAPLAAKDHSNLPPALIITAEFDPLRDDGEYYADSLRQAGVSVKLSQYDGMIHGFLNLGGIIDQTRTLFDEIGAEVRSVLRSPEAA